MWFEHRVQFGTAMGVHPGGGGQYRKIWSGDANIDVSQSFCLLRAFVDTILRSNNGHYSAADTQAYTRIANWQ